MLSCFIGTNMVEGIGDELLFALTVFLGILVPMILYVYRFRQQYQQPQHIHPDSAENVRSARERIQENTTGANVPGENGEAVDSRFNARQQQEGQLSCPICLGNLEYGVDTNCGHFFCGNCIIMYWEHGTWLGAVMCPVCRQQVNLLLVNFTEEENASQSETKRVILEKIYHYNRRFSGAPRSISEYLTDLPTLLRHAFSEFFSVGGLIWMFRLRIVVCFLAAFLYFLSPLDIIPEALFGIFGYLDDLLIVLLLAIYVSIIYRQVLQTRADNRRPPPTAPPPDLH